MSRDQISVLKLVILTGFCGFSQSLQETARILPEIRTRPFPFASFLIYYYYYLVLKSLDAVESELLAVLLNEPQINTVTISQLSAWCDAQTVICTCLHLIVQTQDFIISLL
jgi:hypothetical protein